jgi:hypothetical protein
MNAVPPASSRYKVFGKDEKPNLLPTISDARRRTWQEIPETRNRTADLVIAGAGISGFAAAVAASRRGLDVIVVEPTHMVGGQATAAGVSAFDITFFYDHSLNDYGLWSEIMTRVKEVYDVELNRPVNVGHYRKVSFTPNVVIVERVLSEMLSEEGVTVLRNTLITGATRSAGRVTGLETTAGTIAGTVVIDATEDGQILELAGVPHRLSNGMSNGTTTRGITSKNKAIQDITYTATIQAYPDGVPEELRVTVEPANYAKYTRGYRKIYPPEGSAEKHIHNWGPNGFAGYRGAPDLSSANMHTGDQHNEVTRTNLNYHNDMPVTSKYLEDPVARKQFEAEAKLKTISLIYYIQNELNLPWSVCTDEGFADGPTPPFNPFMPPEYAAIEQHMPLIPYIRESRRIIGLTTLSGWAIRREPSRTEAPWRSDSIAVGTYHPDLHGGRTATDYENYLGEKISHKPKEWREGPFPIPFGTLIPEWVDGLIAAEKNISTTRLASGAIRLHPTVCAIGEAAGATAALAVKKGVQPREVPVSAVQLTLAEGGALLTPLYVEGVRKDSEEFVPATLAAARKKIPTEIIRDLDKFEPFIRLDLAAAVEAGENTIKYIRKWWIDVKTHP